MTQEQAEAIVEALESEGYDGDVYEDYSGRGMYGKTCIGVSSKAPPMVVGYAMSVAGLDWGQLPGRRDSLGSGSIYY